MRKTCALAIALLIAMSLAITAGAKDSGSVIDAWSWEDFKNALPESIPDELAEAAESEETFGEAVEEMSSFSYVTAALLDALGIELISSLKLFCSLCALLMLCAVFSAAGATMSNASLSSAVRFCSAGAIFATVVYTQYEHFARTEEFFSSIGRLMNAMIPMSAGLWAMGGNVSTASAGSASMYVMLGVCENLLGNSVIPICCAMSVLALCDAMSDEMKTGKLMSAIKKIYNFFLGAVMTLLISSLSAQTAISAAADGAAARSARMVSGTVIPILGGSVGETLRTVAGGVTYLKSIAGVGGILMVFAIVLPVGISVLLGRIAFLLCGGIADMLGCSAEGRLLENIGEIYGSILAVVAGVSVTFILALCIFMQSIVAVA